MKLLEKILNGVRRLESFTGDLMMGVKTAHDADSGGQGWHSGVQGSFRDSHIFQTTSHSNIRRIIKIIKPGADETVVVVGCGKGRTLCHFARLPIRQAIGIEISPVLAKIAEENLAVLKGRRAPARVLNIDVTQADLGDCTMLYMFNPFGKDTLRAMLANLEKSRRGKVSPLTIVYVNPICIDVFVEFPRLEKVLEARWFPGMRVVIFKEKPVT